MPKVTRHDIAVDDETDQPRERDLIDSVSVEDYDAAVSGHDDTDLVVGDAVRTEWGAGVVLGIARNSARVQLDDGGEPLTCPLTKIHHIDVISRLVELARRQGLVAQ